MLFLDRDATLIRDPGYLRDPAGVELLPGAAGAVRELAACGFVPAVVSNQSGLARGLVTPAEAAAVHAEFVRQFHAASGLVLPCWYCPHGPAAGCGCRKPRPGLLRLAVRDLFPDPGSAPREGVMVGDKPSDVAAGEAAGYTGLLFAGDWPQAVRAIRDRFALGG